MLTLAFLLAPVALRHVPVAGEKASYTMRATVELSDQDPVRFTGKTVETVKAVANGLVTVAVENTVNVELQSVLRFGRPIASDRVERLDGALVTAAKIEETLLFATARTDRLRAFYAPTTPVEVGAGWWRTEGPSDDLKAPPFASYLKLEGDEKIGTHDAWRVSVDANEFGEEHPTHVKGMVWLDKADGTLVRGQWTVDGFIYNPTAPPGHGRFELLRID